MDIIAPTRERIAKGDLTQPINDQRQRRDYFRSASPFERLLNRDQITHEQAFAGMKLERHLVGATGADARMTEESGPSDIDGIPAVSRHSKAVAEAQKLVPVRQWRAIMMLIEDTDRLHEIGGAVCQRKDQAQASASALTLIQEGLELLVMLWGLAARSRPPSR